MEIDDEMAGGGSRRTCWLGGGLLDQLRFLLWMGPWFPMARPRWESKCNATSLRRDMPSQARGVCRSRYRSRLRPLEILTSCACLVRQFRCPGHLPSGVMNHRQSRRLAARVYLEAQWFRRRPQQLWISRRSILAAWQDDVTQNPEYGCWWPTFRPDGDASDVF